MTQVGNQNLFQRLSQMRVKEGHNSAWDCYGHEKDVNVGLTLRTKTTLGKAEQRQGRERQTFKSRRRPGLPHKLCSSVMRWKSMNAMVFVAESRNWLSLSMPAWKPVGTGTDGAALFIMPCSVEASASLRL